MKYAILLDGTGAYEKCVYTLEGISRADALTKVAEAVIKNEQDNGCSASSHSEADVNNGTPVGTMEIYNDAGDLIYDLSTVELYEF